jgi:hypothetical protein
MPHGRRMLMKGAIALSLPMIVGSCSAPTPIKGLCQAAAHLASANVNLADALTGLERSDASLYNLSIALAEADVQAASTLASRVPSAPAGLLPGTVSALEDALEATSLLVTELPAHDSSDVPALRMRVDDAQLALAGNPGLPDGCTEPIEPPIE